MDQHAIAIHAFGSLTRRQKDIALHREAGHCAVGNEEAKAIPMNAQSSRHIFGVSANGNKVPGAQLHQRAFFAQAVQRFFQRVTIFALQA